MNRFKDWRLSTLLSLFCWGNAPVDAREIREELERRDINVDEIVKKHDTFINEMVEEFEK